MGTCTNWKVSIVAALKKQCSSTPFTLPNLQSDEDLARLASDWRTGFFHEIHQRFENGEAQEDIDFTHRRVLDQLLARKETLVTMDVWGDEIRTELVKSWHHQDAWPDAIEGLERLKKSYFVVVLANGTTRLQLDLVQSSQLPFHSLFSSQLLGLTKPDPRIYQKALELLKFEPEQCIMVAAHAYDLRAAAKIGIKTAYIHRTTEDPHEDMDQVRRECDMFISGTDGSKACGLNALADTLCAWN
ncbi:haloacid dehalogenase [Gymnopus androsaceus JB14]|uniref:Haloacid dehalogenase n=1 Tax=Gymnopus androsaceus JB14 TaxID=1447944 RepID=A0A6A4H4J2_9AGAR|nr:haloacid dehalogenase [Gymnopus androsaceus JB14]